MRIIALTLFTLTALSGAPALAAYDLPYVGDLKKYSAKSDDTLIHVARANELGFVEMRAANPYVDPWLPGEGTEIIFPSRHILPDAPRDGIVINLPEMRLYAFVHGDEAPTTFPLGIGREGLETPLGQTRVVRKTEGPTWRPTPRMRREDPKLPAVVPPGPENPLGTHALYLGWPQYALHGTNKPYGIGRRVSSGCIRLYPENITELYEMIPTGTQVTVVNQPIKLAWIDGRLYLEAHPDMQQAMQMEETGQVYTARLSDTDLQEILKAAGEYQDKLHWPVIREVMRDRPGYPIMIARKPGAPMEEPEIEFLRVSAPAEAVPPPTADEIEAAPQADIELKDDADESAGGNDQAGEEAVINEADQSPDEERAPRETENAPMDEPQHTNAAPKEDGDTQVSDANDKAADDEDRHPNDDAARIPVPNS